MTSADLVAELPPSAECSLPLRIEARTPVGLAEWYDAHRDHLERQLRQHGAVLFRGFALQNAQDFRAIVRRAGGEPLVYDEPTTPRTQVGAGIYTSTDYPPEEHIPPHNEKSYALTVPTRLFFWCEREPEEGGETPLCDTRRVYRRLDPDVREQFERLGWTYHRTFSGRLGLPWQRVFGTDDRGQVEAYCCAEGIEWTWGEHDTLRTKQTRPAVITHPITGETSWFNHAVFFHASSLSPAVRHTIATSWGEDGLPNDTRFGDGSPIDDRMAAHIRDAYDQELATTRWAAGDLLMIDNLLAAHARRPFTGRRRILAAMCQPLRRNVSI